MKKKLILVTAPPACGKNYVSELICNALNDVAYVDKDDLADLLRCSFTLSGEKLDMDGEFYRKHLRPVEYATLLRIAFSTLRYTNYVLVNAPFIKEVRDIEYMRMLKERVASMGAELVVIWVTAPIEVCYERMKKRNAERDVLKLSTWQEYVKNIDYNPPYTLQATNVVDKLFTFDNTNEITAKESLQHILDGLGDNLWN